MPHCDVEFVLTLVFRMPSISAARSESGPHHKRVPCLLAPTNFFILKKSLCIPIIARKEIAGDDPRSKFTNRRERFCFFRVAVTAYGKMKNLTGHIGLPVLAFGKPGAFSGACHELSRGQSSNSTRSCARARARKSLQRCNVDSSDAGQ
jgi:hypothetical protein